MYGRRQYYNKKGQGYKRNRKEDEDSDKKGSTQYRRRGKYNRIGRTRNTIPTGIADRLSIKLKYTTIVNMTSAGPTVNQAFRGNSLYDPDYSGIGTQPLGFDQWASFYRKYKVNGSAIEVDFGTSTEAYTSGLLLVNLTPNTGSGGVPSVRDYSEWAETPYNKNTLVSIVSGGNNVVRLEHYMSTKKIYGRTTEDTDFTASTSADPVLQWFWVIQAHNLANSAVGAYMKVTITYYAEFYDRVQLLTS